MNDLRELMRSRDVDMPPPMSTPDRIAAIRRDVVRIRVRIAAGAAAALAVLLVFTLPAVLGARRSAPPLAPTPAPTTTVPMRDGLAVYQDGAKLIATASGPLNGTVTLVFTAPAGRLHVVMTCPDGIAGVELQVTVNGRVVRSDNRGHGDDDLYECGYVIDFEGAEGISAKVGQLNTITTRIVRAVSAARLAPGPAIPLTADRYTVGVRVPVPFDQYVFPPRPAVLPVWQLRPPPPGDEQHETSGTAPLTFSTRWRCGPGTSICQFAVFGVSQTPGQLVVSINGVDVATLSFWNYYGGQGSRPVADFLPGDLDRLGVHPNQGQTFTITFTPHGLAGRWAVEFGTPRL